jgi:hypothetical protein
MTATVVIAILIAFILGIIVGAMLFKPTIVH